MEFFYRNASPSYKGAQIQPQARNGLLSGLFGGLLGGGTPSYKTVDARGVLTPTPSRSSWLPFVTPTPSYKTAPTALEDSIDLSDESQDGDAESGCGVTQVVVL